MGLESSDVHRLVEHHEKRYYQLSLRLVENEGVRGLVMLMSMQLMR